jgi:hypothetical protein
MVAFDAQPNASHIVPSIKVCSAASKRGIMGRTPVTVEEWLR